MEVKPGYKQTEAGVIPGDWNVFRLVDNFKIYAGGDVPKRSLSDTRSEIYPYPIFANSLQDRGLYGFTNEKRAKADSVTVTARGYVGHAEYRNEPFFPIVRLLVLEPTGHLDAKFTTFAINESVTFALESTGVPQLTAPQIGKYSIAGPCLEEQRAIAQTISEVYTMISNLDRLIAKKLDLKHAVMKQLLTGKTRLLGFKTEWETKELGQEIIRLKKTKRQSSTGKDIGLYPFFTNTTKPVDRFIDEHDYNTEAIIANTGGVAYFNYFKGKFAAMSDCLVFESKINTLFLYYYLKLVEKEVYNNGFTGSGIKHLDKKYFNQIKFLCPVELGEQTAIAGVLADMDAEIYTLEAWRSKTLALMQGMTHELLTGKTRIL